MTEELLTVPEVKKIIKVGTTKLYALMNERKLKAVKLGHKTLVPRSSVDAFIASLQGYKAEAQLPIAE